MTALIAFASAGGPTAGTIRSLSDADRISIANPRSVAICAAPT